MARDLSSSNRIAAEPAVEEACVDGDDVLDFAEYSPDSPQADLTPLTYDQEVKQLQSDLLAAAERLEYEASVLRRQYELLEAAERPKWFH